MVVASVSLLLVILIMLAEARRSRINERWLRERGAIEPPDDVGVYTAMRLAYPGAFAAMALEGALLGSVPGWRLVTGIVVFCAAKALKVWAIASLGRRWTFRVLVLPDAPLVRGGPYAFVRHPNYLAVIGELVGFALVVSAPIAGAMGLIGFSLLLVRRIHVEDRALRETRST